MTNTVDQSKIKYAMEQGYKMHSCWIDTSVMQPIETDGFTIIAYFMLEEEGIHAPVVLAYYEADHSWHSCFDDPGYSWNVDKCRAWIPIRRLDASQGGTMDAKFYHTC